MKPTFRKGTVKWQVLNLICECGELSYKALHVLGNSDKANQNQVLTMKKEGIVQIQTLYKGKTIKLADMENVPDTVLFRNAKEQYKDVISNTYCGSNVKTITNNTKELVNRRRKSIRLGKMTAFMYAAGMYVFSDKSIYKPDLWTKGLSGKERAFYLSTDIKKLFSEDEKRIPNRSLGILVNKNEIFVTYYIDYERQTIRNAQERKAKRVLEYYLETTSLEKGLVEREISKCILLVDDYKLVTDMVVPESSYDIDESIKRRMELDETYQKYYCFPYIRKGVKICEAVLADRKRLKNLPIKRSNRVEEDESIEYDGKEVLSEDVHGKSMLYELSLFDCEIKKLYRFLEFIEFKEYRRRPGEKTDKYKIYCLDFQYEMLESVLRKCNRSKLIKLVSYNTDLVISKFGDRKGMSRKQNEKSNQTI